MHRRGIENHTVVVQKGKSMCVNVKAVVTVKGGLNKGHGITAAKQLLQDGPAPFLFPGRGLIVLPAKLFCLVL